MSKNYYECLAKGIVVTGTVITTIMVKKTYDLMHEYTHRNGWHTYNEWQKKMKQDKKFKEKSLSQKED